MYYHHLFKKVVFDKFDYFLISAASSMYATICLKSYLSEEKKMERLKKDVISKSKLIDESSPSIETPSSSRKKVKKKPTKLRKIPPSTNDIIKPTFIRGGDDTRNKITKILESNPIFQKADRIQMFVNRLVETLKRLGYKYPSLKIITTICTKYLTTIISLWRVSLFAGNANPEDAIMALTFGTGTGFVIGWFGVGATIAAHGLLVTFVLRYFYQQTIHDRAITDLQDEIFPELIKELKKNNSFLKRLKEKKVQYNIRELIENNEPKLTLNWEEKPAIKEAAERLGIFERKPLTKPIEIIKSTQNLKDRYLKKKNRVETLRKIAEKIIDVNKDLDIIDVDVIHEN